jgi:hypothetical protein
MKLEFSRQILEKFSNVKFYGKLSIDSRVDPCGQTDVRGEANSRFLEICERAQEFISGFKKSLTHFHYKHQSFNAVCRPAQHMLPVTQVCVTVETLQTRKRLLALSLANNFENL